MKVIPVVISSNGFFSARITHQQNYHLQRQQNKFTQIKRIPYYAKHWLRDGEMDVRTEWDGWFQKHFRISSPLCRRVVQPCGVIWRIWGRFVCDHVSSVFFGGLSGTHFVVRVIRVCRKSTGMGYVIHRFRCLFTCGANSFSIDSYRTNGLMAVAWTAKCRESLGGRSHWLIEFFEISCGVQRAGPPTRPEMKCHEMKWPKF